MAASAALLLSALTACGGGGDDAAAKPEKSTASEVTPSEPTPGQVEKGMKLGEPARTTGDGGTGVLEITPDTIVFTKEASGETAENGLFVVVTMKDKAMTAVAADEPAPISGGGWKWMAPDGEMVDSDGGNAFNIVIDKYNNADPVQPGGYQWRLKAFDLTATQAKGGTLIYIDGEERAFRWEMPSTDSGPNAAEVKKQLKA
ncbi:hypothetical protein ACFY2M_19075 [Streptomyces sp. NPDC001276]|uniref:hypothetical protein n=1 Tax=Streptomyces sp. NPDC001276 TaxID=3364555 RepID=UPI0036AEB878